jgi:hypothetical protein
MFAAAKFAELRHMLPVLPRHTPYLFSLQYFIDNYLRLI